MTNLPQNGPVTPEQKDSVAMVAYAIGEALAMLSKVTPIDTITHGLIGFVRRSLIEARAGASQLEAIYCETE